jgi:hypothetical protein
MCRSCTAAEHICTLPAASGVPPFKPWLWGERGREVWAEPWKTGAAVLSRALRSRATQPPIHPPCAAQVPCGVLPRRRQPHRAHNGHPRAAAGHHPQPGIECERAAGDGLQAPAPEQAVAGQAGRQAGRCGQWVGSQAAAAMGGAARVNCKERRALPLLLSHSPPPPHCVCVPAVPRPHNLLDCQRRIWLAAAALF